MKIYIVAFAPSKDSPNDAGWYDWRLSREDAVRVMVDHLNDAGYDYTFMEVDDVPGDLGRVEEWIEKNVELP